MRSAFKKVFIFSLAIAVLAFLPSARTGAQTILASAATSTDALTLQQMIEAKSNEMKQIESQKQALQDKLDQISQSKTSLSQEVQSLNYQISQLNLQIQANQLTSRQLALEIQSSNQGIQDTQNEIVQRKQAIAKLMVELEQADDESPFFTILGGATLSDSFKKVNEIYTLNQSLVDSLSRLADLQDSLSQKIAEASRKKIQKQQEEANLTNTQSILQDQKQTKNVVLAETKSREQIYQDQMLRLDEQQLQISQVIEGIESKLRASFNPKLLPTAVHTVLSFPVENAIVTQGYGYTKFAARAYRTDFHTGIDFGVSIGTPVYAAADGVVVRVDNNDQSVAKWRHYQYGKYIVIGHANNLSTLYAHLSKQIVSAGDIIKRGQIVGYSGNTGYATGPHLHFGVYYTPELEFKSIPPAHGLVPVGLTVSPMVYLPDTGYRIKG